MKEYSRSFGMLLLFVDMGSNFEDCIGYPTLHMVSQYYIIKMEL
jgi:hypothetical protein